MTTTIKDIEAAEEGLGLFLADIRSTLHEVTSLGIKHYKRAEKAEKQLAETNVWAQSKVHSHREIVRKIRAILEKSDG